MLARVRGPLLAALPTLVWPARTWAQEAAPAAGGAATPHPEPGALAEAFKGFFTSFAGDFWSGGVKAVAGWQIAYLLAVTVIAWIVGWALQAFILRWLAGLAQKAGFKAPAKLLQRLRHPLTFCATFGLMAWGVADAGLPEIAGQRLMLVVQALLASAFVAVAYRAVGVLEGIAAGYAEGTEGKLDDQLVPMVGRVLRVAVVTLGVVFVLQNQGVEVASLLAGLGIGGIAIALAAKDTVENLFGSLTIFLDRPFQIGDWVVIDGKWEGVVEAVGLRSTRIRTFGKSMISVPNGKVGNSTIDNMGQRPFRRQTGTLGIEYGTPPEKIEALVARMNAIVEEHPETWKGTVEIHFKDFGASSLDIMIYFFVDAPDWHRELQVRQAIFLAFMQAARELGVGLAFPSTSLYVEKLPTITVQRAP